MTTKVVIFPEGHTPGFESRAGATQEEEGELRSNNAERQPCASSSGLAGESCGMPAVRKSAIMKARTKRESLTAGRDRLL